MLIDTDGFTLWEKIQQVVNKEKLTFEKNEYSKLPDGTLSEALNSWREKSIKRGCHQIQFQNKTVLIHEEPQKYDNTHDLIQIIGRGIDMARAVCFIQDILLSKEEEKENDPLRQLCFQFLRDMSPITEKSKALNQLKKFHGDLLRVIHPSNKNKKKAFHALCFVRDFLWRKDFDFAYCMTQSLQNNQTFIEYAESMTFPKIAEESALDDEKQPLLNKNPWSNLHQQPWLINLKKSFGNLPWVDDFFKINATTLESMSPTPMSRATPNPANTVTVTNLIAQDKTVTILGQHIKTATLESFNLKSKQQIKDVTLWNHAVLFKNTQEAGMKDYLSIWESLYEPTESIPFYRLHQTFIADEVMFSPDQNKAETGSIIDGKYHANQTLRHKNSYQVNEHSVRPIELESNHCINMWEKRSRIRNQDLQSGRTLIEGSVALFRKAARKHEAVNADLQTIIHFLNQQNHSWFTPHLSRGKAVKAARDRLLALCLSDDNTLSAMPIRTRYHLALSLAAAIELKCVVHETWLGAMRRLIANWTRTHLRRWYFLGLGHVLDGLIRLTLTILAKVCQIILLIPLTIHGVKHAKDRDAISRATYEGLLAEGMGLLVSGCMSALDRTGEMVQLREAHKRQLFQEKKMLGYNDTNDEKARFFKTYTQSPSKNIQALYATGTSETINGETHGLFSPNLPVGKESHRTILQGDLNARKLRHGEYKSPKPNAHGLR